MERILTPAGQTGKYQPLDVGVNKAFNGFYRQKFHKWRKALKNAHITKKGNLRNPTGEEILNFIFCSLGNGDEALHKKGFDGVWKGRKNPCLKWSLRLD